MFAPQVHSLLQTHEGMVPLLSFPDCYAAEFGELELVQENQGGVPLEHFITCVPGVNVATAQNGVKVVRWIHNKPPAPNTGKGQARQKHEFVLLAGSWLYSGIIPITVQGHPMGFQDGTQINQCKSSHCPVAVACMIFQSNSSPLSVTSDL